jgi:hypothetical protein
MAFHASRLSFIGIGMRIVTDAAPQRIARGPFTGALRALLHMAGYFHVLPVRILFMEIRRFSTVEWHASVAMVRAAST